MCDKVGVVHGRFQLLHNDHIKYMMQGFNKCDHLIIGICNPDILHFKYTTSNPHRSQIKENPFTYYERFQMIKGTLLEMGIHREKFDIVPFPINMPKLIFDYSPQNATYYLTIYDAWGYEKKRILESIGCKVSVLWETDLAHKGISGSSLRTKIVNGENWKPYVPNYVYNYVKKSKLDVRLINA